MERYRPDIDGLRAVAVVGVVLFHAGVPGFGGGFAGVDVFFVISGYLITQLILRDQDRGFAYIIAFYERRARRIIPALYALFALTLIGALLLFPPYDLADFSQSLAAASIFLSNVWFWKQEGYFTLAAHSQPLLHLWSLSVEEQFYVVYPLVTLAVLRFAPRTFSGVLAAIFLISLAASQIVIDRADHPAFYLAHLRAWELALGALLARSPLIASVPQAFREAMSGLGLLAIVCTFAFFSAGTAFPGVNALLPTTGAAAYLFANTGTSTLTGRVLSVPPVRYVGLISYSLYLCHWPLLVFLGAIRLGAQSNLETAAAIALSFAIAALSLKFIETPFRKKHGTPSGRRFFRAAIAGAALFLSAGLAIDFSNGLPQRMPDSVRRMAAYEGYAKTAQFVSTFAAGTCFQWRREEVDRRAFAQCLMPDKGAANILLWGDSHAGHYSAGLRALARQQHFHLLQATGTGCRPITTTRKDLSRLCNTLNGLAAHAIETLHPQAVIVSLYWLRDSPANLALTIDEIAPTIDFLRKRKVPVILIGPGLVFQESLPAILARRLLYGEGTTFDPASFLAAGWEAGDETLFKRFGYLQGVHYLSVRQSMCPNGRCPVMATSSVPLVWDNSHLTLEGSLLVAQRLFGKTILKIVDARPISKPDQNSFSSQP